MIDETLAEMQEFGHAPPPSLTDRRYSGSFTVRTSRPHYTLDDLL
jgi:hypothetical protein